MSTKNLEVYFAYASNINPYQMKQRCPSSVAIGEAQLRHHELHITHHSPKWEGGVCGILEAPGEENIVTGILYQLTLEDLEMLDSHEGPRYERRDHPIEINREFRGGVTLARLSAWVYVCIEKTGNHVIAEAYADTILEGADLHGLDASFSERINGFRSIRG